MKEPLPLGVPSCIPSIVFPVKSEPNAVHKNRSAEWSLRVWFIAPLKQNQKSFSFLTPLSVLSLPLRHCGIKSRTQQMSLRLFVVTFLLWVIKYKGLDFKKSVYSTYWGHPSLSCAWRSATNAVHCWGRRYSEKKECICVGVYSEET